MLYLIYVPPCDNSKCGKFRKVQVCINFLINSACFAELNPPGYDQRCKHFCTNSFVLAHAPAKKILQGLLLVNLRLLVDLILVIKT